MARFFALVGLATFVWWMTRATSIKVDSGKMHFVVTGGAGFIGSHATLQLLENGHSVTVIDNLSRGNMGALYAIEKALPHSSKRFKYRILDLGDKPALVNLFRKLEPVDFVIHFAAIAFVGESMREPIRYYSNVTTNTVNLLEAMQQANPPIKKLIYSSTCAVYGNPKILPITEDTPTIPVNPYGRSKLFAENAVRDLAVSDKEFQAVILRYFNVIGSDPSGRIGELPRPELKKDSRVSTACFDAAFGDIESLSILGTTFPTPDGTAIRDYVHVTDLVDAHVAVLSHAANPPPIFNVGTGRGVSVKEFVESCKTAVQKPLKVVQQKAPRPGDYAQVYANVSRINAIVGWRAKHTNLEESLRQAWTWRSQHHHQY